MPKKRQFVERPDTLRPVHSIAEHIRGLHGILGVMKLLDLSFAGMGREIARMEGRWPVYQKSTVHNWTRRSDHKRYVKMPVEHRTPLANLLTEWAREQTGNDRLIVSVHMNSPMRARLWVPASSARRSICGGRAGMCAEGVNKRDIVDRVDGIISAERWARQAKTPEPPCRARRKKILWLC